MLTMDGRVLGIITFRREKSYGGRPVDNIGFALSGPAVHEWAHDHIDNLETPPTPVPTATHHHAQAHGNPWRPNADAYCDAHRYTDPYA